jgi:hypothetical protein
MKLYHGSNQIIERPDLSKGRSFLDFGRGFYLASEKSLQYLHYNKSYKI